MKDVKKVKWAYHTLKKNVEEIEGIQIIGKKLIMHDDDREHEKMAKKQPGKHKTSNVQATMSSPWLGNSDAGEALVIEISDISQGRIRT